MSIRVLYCGHLGSGRNSRSMLDAFKAAERFDVRALDHALYQPQSRAAPSYWTYRKTHGITSRALRRFRADLLMATDGWSPDIVCCFKTVDLPQQYFLDLPGLKIHYSPDDASNPANVSPDYLQHEGEWDLIVTTKRHNVQELKSRGVGRVLFVLSAYDPSIHFDDQPLTARRYTASFFGARRPDRSRLPAVLSEAGPTRSIVAGERWRRAYPVSPKDVRIVPPVYGSKFRPFCRKSFSGIVLLNSENRDTHTCRTFEVAAAGQFPIAQETDEHREILNDQALYFNNMAEIPELLRKLEADRWAYARRAEMIQKFVVSRGSTYDDRVKQILTVA